MGCSIKKTFRIKTGENQEKIDCLDKVVVNPGLFIKKNPNKFVYIFKLGTTLYKGKYNQVRECVNRDTGEKKLVKIKDKRSHDAELEILILKSLDHPCILKLFEYFEDDQRYYLILENCQGKELFQEILSGKVLNENKIAIIMQQLFSVLAYLHDHHIVHRNLTPSNILIESSNTLNLKIINFSRAVKCDQTPFISGSVGSPYFASPEMENSAYSCKTDLWSVGVIFCLLLSGTPPYIVTHPRGLKYLGPTENFGISDEIWNKTSEPGKSLLASLLSPEPQRISAKESLNHPWLTQNLHRPICSEALKTTVLTRLSNFHAFHKLREAVYSFIISQLVTVDETRLLREIFKDIDKDADGKISVQELAEEYSKLLESEEAFTLAEKIMKEVDSDNSGYIDYTEFLKGNLNSQKVLSNERLKKAFQMFDKDESGTISACELREVLQGAMESDDSLWKEIISSVDQNRDNEIDLCEFQDIILSNCLKL